MAVVIIVEMQKEVVTSLVVVAVKLVVVKVVVEMVEVREGVPTGRVAAIKLVVVMLEVETGKAVEVVMDTWHQSVAEV